MKSDIDQFLDEIKSNKELFDEVKESVIVNLQGDLLKNISDSAKEILNNSIISAWDSIEHKFDSIGLSLPEHLFSEVLLRLDISNEFVVKDNHKDEAIQDDHDWFFQNESKIKRMLHNSISTFNDRLANLKNNVSKNLLLSKEILLEINTKNQSNHVIHLWKKKQSKQY